MKLPYYYSVCVIFCMRLLITVTQPDIIYYEEKAYKLYRAFSFVLRKFVCISLKKASLRDLFVVTTLFEGLWRKHKLWCILCLASCKLRRGKQRIHTRHTKRKLQIDVLHRYNLQFDLCTTTTTTTCVFIYFNVCPCSTAAVLSWHRKHPS